MKKILFLVLKIVAFALITTIVMTLVGLPFVAFVKGEWATWLIDKATFSLGVTVASLFLLKQWWRTLGLSMRGRGRDVASGMAVALLIYLIGFLFSWALGAIEVLDVHFVATDVMLSWLLMLLVAYSEEVALRGFVLGQMLDAGINKFVALCLSSLLFSLFHLFNPEFSLLPMINIFLAGVLLGASYIYTRNLWFPISLHLFWNWTQGLLGFQVSGTSFGASLFTLRLPEENLINGGAFGFEGSLLCTLLMLLFTILILRGASNQCASVPHQLSEPSPEHADE